MFQKSTSPSEAQPLLAVRSFGLTDDGRVIAAHQDQYLVAVLLRALPVEQTSLPQRTMQTSQNRSQASLIADGMGAPAGGDQVIDSVETYILGAFRWSGDWDESEQDHVFADLQSALCEANSRVLAEAKDWPELRGKGTALTLAHSLNDVLFVAHVGDTRCYLRRRGIPDRLTREHTPMEEIVHHGTVAIEDAAKLHLHYVINNVVGGSSSSIKVEVHKLQLEAGDRVLLCSDALTRMVTDDQIHEILYTATEPEDACRQLVARPNESGDRNNITVVVADFAISSQAVLKSPA